MGAMSATPLVVLGLIVLVLAGCVGAGPSGGPRAGCSDNRYSTATSIDAPPSSFFFMCVQSP